MSKTFEQMTNEELEQFIDAHQGEKAEEEAYYVLRDRLEWKPLFDENAGVEEIEQAVNRLIAQKTGQS